jgi:hypothetical protein
VGMERGPLSLVATTEELLGRERGGSGMEIRANGLGIRRADHMPLSARKFGNHFADKRRSFGRYCSLAVTGHKV